MVVEENVIPLRSDMVHRQQIKGYFKGFFCFREAARECGEASFLVQEVNFRYINPISTK